MRDFIPEYQHAKFGCHLTTNKGETGGTLPPPAYMVPKDPSLNRVNPQKYFWKGFALKGIRQHIIKMNNPSTICPDKLLTVRSPDLKENQVIVPRTAKLTFNISLAGTYAKRTLVKNLCKNITRKLVVKLEGNEIISTDVCDIFYS